MKKIYLRQIFSLLLLTSFLPSLYAHDSELAIFVDKSYPPYMYELDETKAEGLYPRLIEEIMKGTGLKANIIAAPWKRALHYGEKGVGAVGGAYMNDERLKVYDYSAPLYQEKLVVFVNKNKPFEFNEIADLSGKMIGVNRGWSYGQEFDAARESKLFKVSVRGDPSENFKMLALGRIDCLILDQLSGESYVQLLGMSDKIMPLPVPFSMNNGYLIISKSLEKKSFLEKFDASLKAMQESGAYKDIVRAFIEGTMTATK